MFLMKIVCKVYERVKKIQNENKKSKCTKSAIAGKKKQGNYW